MAFNRYQQALGHLKKSVSDTAYTPGSIRETQRELTALLREILSPMCSELAAHVKAMSPNEIRVYNNFEFGVYAALYPHSMAQALIPLPNPEDAVMQHRALQAELDKQPEIIGGRVRDLVDASREREKELEVLQGRIGKLGIRHYYSGRYEGAVASHFEEVMAMITVNGIGPLKPRLPVEKRPFYACYWSPSECMQPISVANAFVNGHVIVPIGAYGADFTERVINTTKVLLRLSETLLSEHSEYILEEHKRLFAEQTARGNPLAAFQEGVRSLADSISLLAAEKGHHIESPMQYLEAIFKSSLPARISQIFPLGILGPMMLSGYYLPGLVDTDVRGGATLNLAKIREINEIRRPEKPHIKEGGVSSGFGLQHGCPVGKASTNMKTTGRAGIDALSEAFLHVYRALD